MKKTDKFGYPIYEDTYRNMKRYSEKLMRMGFKEAKNKPDLFYFGFEYGVVFADMRGYKDNWGRFLPIWCQKRKGAPRFYQMTQHYDVNITGKINRKLWELYQLIKYEEIPFIRIGPFCEPESVWSLGKIPRPQFFLEHSEKPLVVNDFWEPGFYYSGYCLKCKIEIDGEDLFCEKCRNKIPPKFFSHLRYLIKDYYFNNNPSKNCISFVKYPLEDFNKELAEMIRKRRFKQKFNRSKENICVLCGKHSKDSVKHHINYHPPKFMTLCRSCHGIVHSCSFPNPYWEQKREKKPKIKCAYCSRNHINKDIAQKHRILHVIETLKNLVDKSFIKLKKSKDLEKRIRLNRKHEKYKSKMFKIKESLPPKEQRKISEILSELTIIDETKLAGESRYKDLTDFIK